MSSSTRNCDQSSDCSCSPAPAYQSCCRRNGATFDLDRRARLIPVSKTGKHSGVDLFAVGKVLGHADYKSTMRYSDLANETLLSAVEAGAPKLSAQWAT